MSDHKIIPSAINPTGKPASNAEELAKQRVAHSNLIQWLDRLTSNEDFKKYIEFIQQGADSARAKAGAIETLSTEQRAAYGQHLLALLDMIEWPGKQLEFSRASIRALDEQQRQLQS